MRVRERGNFAERARVHAGSAQSRTALLAPLSLSLGATRRKKKNKMKRKKEENIYGEKRCKMRVRYPLIPRVVNTRVVVAAVKILAMARRARGAICISHFCLSSEWAKKKCHGISMWFRLELKGRVKNMAFLSDSWRDYCEIVFIFEGTNYL